MKQERRGIFGLLYLTPQGMLCATLILLAALLILALLSIPAAPVPA